MSYGSPCLAASAATLLKNAYYAISIRIVNTPGGLETGKDEHLFWRDAILKTGDALRLKVVERRTVDKPRTRVARDRKAETQAQKKNVRKLAKQFGWELKANRSR